MLASKSLSYPYMNLLYSSCQSARVLRLLTAKARRKQSGSTEAWSSTCTKVMQSSDPDWFRYTSGRWIYNDTRRHLERYLEFNPRELQRVAAASVGCQSSDTLEMKKIAEGALNRVFRISLRSGSRVIARVPYPISFPKGFATASEVATMNFLRSHGLPIPEIYAYATNKHNPVGTEYIIMEEVSGEEIGDRWYDMTEDQRTDLVFQIAELESKLFSIDFPASGSIYHPHDLDPRLSRIALPGPQRERKYCIGPSVAQTLWFGKRSDIDADRGPFVDTTSAFEQGARKEIAFLSAHGHDRYPFSRIRREVYSYSKQSPENHLHDLQKFLQIAPILSPPSDSQLGRPTLRHPDLQPRNIFVSKDFKITGLIDWQHSSVLPLFLQAGVPRYIQTVDDKAFTLLTPPRLPEGFELLDNEQQAQAAETFRQQHLHFFYMAATSRMNPTHFDALAEPFTGLNSNLFKLTSNPWEGDNVSLRATLIEVIRNWPALSSHELSCPIYYSNDQIRECLQLYEHQREADAQLMQTEQALGVGPEGWVSTEHYEDIKALAAEIKRLALEDADSETLRAEIEEHWPFDDHDEDE